MLHQSRTLSAARRRRAGIAVRMSAVMVERESAFGACTEDQLVAAGFTRTDIALHAAEAAGLAARHGRRA